MPKINFLGADVPLTKRIYADGTKDAYPLVKNFTSYSEEINDIKEFHSTIRAHAELGHCLLKGELTRPLTKEPRAGSTRTDDMTQWVCLDFDRYECASIDEALQTLGLCDISHVIQFSSSHGLSDNEGTFSAHVFMLLDKPLPAPVLKSWLMGLNLDHLRGDIRLARAKTVLSWPLDITTCQNDKLLYIAPPSFVKPASDPLRERIRLVLKSKPSLTTTLIGERNINVLKAEERKLLNVLREAEGLTKRTAKTAWVGAVEMQSKPDVCTVTGIKEQGEFVRLNLNGGDSWAYWHPKDNFELIHDFKSDSWYKTKELVPGYYQTLSEARSALNATPTEDGDLILAFRDLKTAEYYNGLWNPETKSLELYRAKNETQLDHWMRSHGRFIGDFIPVWDIQYDPRASWVIDEQNHCINTFKPSPYMELNPENHPVTSFPTIFSIIRHLLGDTDNKAELTHHFLNWFAVIMQRKAKPLTAWVVHGCEGTGKGYFFNKIASPLLSSRNTMSITVSNLEDQFNAWLEGKLFVLIDEIEVDDFREKGRVTAKLRNYITEPTIAIRRMRQSTIDAPNYASFLFSSNRPQPVFIPPSDRRYNVGNYQPVKLERPDDEIVSKELTAFAEWLLAHKADTNKANEIMNTPARELIKNLGISSIAETCNAMKEGDLETLWLSMLDDELLNRAPVQTAHITNAQQYGTLIKRIAQEALTMPRQTLSRDEMALILQYNVGNIRPEPNRVTSLLRHNGIETKQVRHRGKKTYGIHVEWKISDEFRAELESSLKLVAKLRKVK